MNASDGRKLNVVDENGTILGEEQREIIHAKGLLHREVHVWLYTPLGEVVFQHRGKNKDTYPDLLDATVGGHVEIGAGYVDTALKELEEETGVHASEDDLIFICTMRDTHYDVVTGMTNNVLRAVYAYRYDGKLSDLRVEKGKAVGFEAWPFETLFNATDKERQRFIPTIFEDQIMGILHAMQALPTKQ